jgi:hypothetical protein
MKVVQRMNLEEVAQWVKFGKVEPWIYSVKNLEMISCYSNFQLKAMYIHRMIYHLKMLKNKRIDETTTNNENKPQLVLFSSIFELSQPAPFHSVFQTFPKYLNFHPLSNFPTPYHTIPVGMLILDLW